VQSDAAEAQSMLHSDAAPTYPEWVTVLDIVTDPAARPPITSFEGHFE
jgi:hypothetical protein